MQNTSVDTYTRIWTEQTIEGSVQDSTNESQDYSLIESTEENGDKNVVSPASMSWLWQPITWSWWVILQMITALFGIVGNSLVIIIIFQRRKKSRSTDTLVGALAVADLITSIFMVPLPPTNRVPSTALGNFYCKVVYTSMFMWVSVSASIFTLTFIPIERYIAVVYPFRCKELLAPRRISIAIICLWFTAFMSNSLSFFISTVDPSVAHCRFIYPKMFQLARARHAMGVFLFLIEFLFPAILTITFQVLTAHALHRQARLQLGEAKQLDRSNPSTRHLIAKKRVLQTLFIVVLIFLICWGPSKTLYLAFALGIVRDSYPYSPFNRALATLGFCNSCANPIIYTVRYPEFRTAVRGLFTRAQLTEAPLFGDRETK
ncbi:galanin receptor type 1-like [Lytechinus variegatus]|uniref:galanin receptor type 1-like n=1 Tax=Lytechinus variegatus TaxID=7654 RepID=UPI001BB2609D|nr:galanin receptor type 1-like [Lytechinus variegatus]